MGDRYLIKCAALQITLARKKKSSELRMVPTFVSVHTFCASWKPRLSAMSTLGLTLMQSTMIPSTQLK